MLKQAIIYAKGEEGQVPQTHIDHIYRQVYKYIIGNDLDKRRQVNKRNRRKVGAARGRYKKYKYARTQDLSRKTLVCSQSIYEITPSGWIHRTSSHQKKRYQICLENSGGKLILYANHFKESLMKVQRYATSWI
jgi:hypothetical protein